MVLLIVRWIKIWLLDTSGLTINIEAPSSWTVSAKSNTGVPGTDAYLQLTFCVNAPPTIGPIELAKAHTAPVHP